MILSCQNISKAFVENQVLKNVSFHIEDHEKAAIVGINGAGKTTLLRIIVGEMTPDDGQVVLARDKTLGYLAQNSTVDTSHTIYEELLSVKADLLRLEEKIRECENNMKHAEGDALEDLMKQYTSLTHAFETGGGYLYRSELVGVLKGLGFTEDEFSKPVATLSGGQKTRVALGRLLLQNPDLIILDEPTNHLDMNSIAWLETYLLNYKGAVLIVSHDRYFLDRIAGKVIEIDQSKATTFMGNYSDYAVKKEQLRVAAWNAYMNQQREIKHQEEVIEKFSKFGSPYIGHPNNKLPGIEMNSGSLGHGLPVCVGMALAGKMDKKDYRVYTVMGDGELAEGSVWEGAMSAGNYKLDNLCAIVDRNRLQISGNTEDVMKQDSQEERWAAFGWNVLSVPGNDMDALVHAFELAKHCKGKPTVIIANTTKGCGSSVMENKAEWHHKVPTPEEVEQIMKDLDERKEALS